MTKNGVAGDMACPPPPDPKGTEAMDNTQRAIITLLRAAVTGEKLPLPADFSLEEAQPYIRRHNIATLAYAGAVNCGIPRTDPAMKALFRDYCRYLLISEGQERALERIFAAFDENGIDYMPLKGCNMKALYPKPEMRVMGDADILIRLEQYVRISQILEALGFAAAGESDHEIPWRSEALYIELHKRLIPSYNQDFYAYFGEGWQLAKCQRGTRYSMRPEDEMVYLFTHFAKHYRDGGIGCRHVVDLWVFRRAHPELDETVVKAELKKLRLVEFYENTLRLIAAWFEDAPSDDKMDFMTEFIIASGSWGEMESRVVSIGVRDMRRTKTVAEGRLHYFLRTAFPSCGTLQNKYTILRKFPWMLPLVWLCRPFYKLLFERNTLARHKDALNALTREKLDERHEMLQYVGLDYNF